MLYDIYLGNEVVGTAEVERQGLYYRFSCRCRFSGSTIYRIFVSCHGHRENLGIPVPIGGVFGLDTRVAVKHLGEGEFRFQALPKHTSAPSQFIPIYPEEPFAYIARLQNAFLEIRNGQPGVILR